ncbi:MAG: zinc ABC transporter substrate-binding protein [Cycloclasticus sp.]|nr:zinc ABC transporter substrate-binding protein [Cycloclasticus sp.]MBG95761.1 zinc ABC transporter substrate-binding protein [Cycloclasticus sp.]HAI96896.1 zinc ABC transporter substrate-binding protein [Methylococcaceae bacterium]|tara:strand:- start:55 stop:954 length:900 start_codon:yes stop_codon:yes gene_type:complete
MFIKKFKRNSLLLLSLLLLSNPLYAGLEVFACEPEWASLAKELGGEHVDIYTATTNQQDPHHIQARPSLVAKARQADLLVCTGAELEIGWLPLLLRKSGNPNIQEGQAGYFLATDYVALLDKPIALDRSMGDVHAAGNPHVHLDPVRVQIIANKLSETLARLDPANRSDYEKKLASFTENWQNMIQQWAERTQHLKGKPIVVHHKNWTYLQHWLGLNQAAVLEPKPGIPPTSSHLSSLVSGLKANPAQVIVYASYQDSKAANWLSKKTGIPTLELAFSPATDETLVHWFDQLLNQLVAL